MNARNMMALLLLPLLFVIGCENPTDLDLIPDPDPGYELGDFQLRDSGPAGGLIFYIDETDEFDWTFLEAAPQGAETEKKWASSGTTDNAGTQNEIGTGKSNTDLIVTKMEDNSVTDTAAQYCDGLTYGGYSDWFLPSRDELERMMVELYQFDNNSNLGDFTFTEDENYWSSSEVNQLGAAIQPDGVGNPYSTTKTVQNYVRPVRTF